MAFWQTATVPMGMYYVSSSFKFIYMYRTFIWSHTHTHTVTCCKRLKVECCVLVCYFLSFFLVHLLWAYHFVFWVHHDTVLTHLFHDGRHNLLAFLSSVSASSPLNIFTAFGFSMFAFPFVSISYFLPDFFFHVATTVCGN